jgi:hypothetical protein
MNFADVVIDAPPFFDGVDNRGDVVVGQDHDGGLSSNFGARPPHGDTDVSGA